MREHRRIEHGGFFAALLNWVQRVAELKTVTKTAKELRVQFVTVNIPYTNGFKTQFRVYPERQQASAAVTILQERGGVMYVLVL